MHSALQWVRCLSLSMISIFRTALQYKWIFRFRLRSEKQQPVVDYKYHAKPSCVVHKVRFEWRIITSTLTKKKCRTTNVRYRERFITATDKSSWTIQSNFSVSNSSTSRCTPVQSRATDVETGKWKKDFGVLTTQRTKINIHCRKKTRHLYENRLESTIFGIRSDPQSAISSIQAKNGRQSKLRFSQLQWLTEYSR